MLFGPGAVAVDDEVDFAVPEIDTLIFFRLGLPEDFGFLQIQNLVIANSNLL